MIRPVHDEFETPIPVRFLRCQFLLDEDLHHFARPGADPAGEHLAREAGQGDVVAATYEFGNTFLIVSGLLNMLIVLDVYDLATGRKPR